MAVTDTSTTSTARVSRGARLGAPSATLITGPAGPPAPPAVRVAYDALLANVDLALGPNAGGMVAVAAIDESASAPAVAANLALVAAQSGDRTLLVDCDLQAAALGDLFGLDAAPGLVQLLGGEHTDLHTLAQPTTLPLLGVITAGAAGAHHARLARFGDIPETLLRLKNAADRVFLAAPPVLAGGDTLRLASYVDGVLLVAAPGCTTREAAARARAILDKAAAPLLGVALA